MLCLDFVSFVSFLNSGAVLHQPTHKKFLMSTADLCIEVVVILDLLLAYFDIPTCYFVSTRVCFCNFEQGPKLLCEG